LRRSTSVAICNNCTSNAVAPALTGGRGSQLRAAEALLNPSGGARPHRRARIATRNAGPKAGMVDSWRPPSPAGEDRNVMASGLSTATPDGVAPALTGGRGSQPEAEEAGPPLRPPVAPALTGGRGSQLFGAGVE